MYLWGAKMEKYIKDMKSRYYFILFLFCYFSSNVFAQITIPRYPSMTLGTSNDLIYPKVNKVHCKKYNHLEFLGESVWQYDYSDNFLNLTITLNNADESTIMFNSDGTIASEKAPRSNLDATYFYTNDGRISKIESRSNDGKLFNYTLFSYNNNLITKTSYHFSNVYNKFIKIYKEVYEYHKDYNKCSLYDYNIESDEWELRLYFIYLLDSYGRTIEIDTYYKDGRKWIDSQYTYTDNGYIQYQWDTNRHYSIREYTFNKNNYLTKEVWYNWYEDNRKDLLWVCEYEYSSEITSNEKINNTIHAKVYSFKKHLIIENKVANTEASIYNTSGHLLKKIFSSDSRMDIPLNSGIYIVVINNQSYKVLIK